MAQIPEETDIQPRPQATRIDAAGDDVEIGQWFWVTNNNRDEDDTEARWLGCVTRIGSNYIELTRAGGDGLCTHYTRVHNDERDELCEFEPNAKEVIEKEVDKYRREAQALMERVQQLTASLGVGPRAALQQGGETEAIAIRGDSQPISAYKKALTKAKDTTLPELFEQIQEANERMGEWMKAPLLGLQAEAEGLETIIETIEGRIFNVELYAGLVEEVKQIAAGRPAAIGEQINIFQRRAYMDEECLADYQTGGMEFRDIKAFDKWLVKPENLNRLLPFPRSIIAFQVRRNAKVRDMVSLREFITIIFSRVADYDKLTFLYMRNGEQVFRLNTSIEFGYKLFPDMERALLSGAVYARRAFEKVDNLISEGEYLGMLEREAEAVAAYERKKESLKERGVPKNGWWKELGLGGPRKESVDYYQWTPDDVYYDEIAAYVKKQIDEHNRLVIVLQGILDRSPVFHPHPPWRLWDSDGFTQAIKPIYDDSRALSDGDKPDFEAYRARLNESLKAGSITVGQEEYWTRVEAERENNRRRSGWRSDRGDRGLTRYRPPGNPGPGALATVKSVSVAKGCSYTWTRERQTYRRYSNDSSIQCSLTVPTAELLNVEAYAPGDFKIFFNDPRTRTEYLKWAPLLLAAEEWHAGNQKVDGRPITKRRKRS